MIQIAGAGGPQHSLQSARQVQPPEEFPLHFGNGVFGDEVFGETNRIVGLIQPEQLQANHQKVVGVAPVCRVPGFVPCFEVDQVATPRRLIEEKVV